jgi:nitrate reductase beta subunit
MMTGKPMVPESGPNWDDDLGGSPVYAEHDPNLTGLTDAERRELFTIERLVFFYLPRTCNHCLNPACVAACPSGAFYKRGEDGIVLVDQSRCRGWRSCVAACPYKKTFFNWASGKSEKCILCFPRIESGQAPACFHACPGRIRYLGVLLYDADRIKSAAATEAGSLVDAQRSMLLDPCDPQVAEDARRCGIADSTIEAARRSPVDRFVRQWRLALPLHPEFRTLPMLFYVPPLSPSIGENGPSRVSAAFLASMFAAGDQSAVGYSLRKIHAVRARRRAETVGDINRAEADRLLGDADCTENEADEIYRLTALATIADRFVVPPSLREQAADVLQEPRQ